MTLTGRYAWVEPLNAERHAAQLYAAFSGHDWLWDYLAIGPFQSAPAFHRAMKEMLSDPSLLFFAIYDADTRKPVGFASYLRITPSMGSIEVGFICIAPTGQRSRVFSEAMFLMMQWAFEAGYRRYEWKCNALNDSSRRAAQRLGFSYEGVFRQAMVIKGRNRDTAWFAVTDGEWPALHSAFDAWLQPANFDADGQQKERLSDLTRLVRVSSDPSL